MERGGGGAARAGCTNLHFLLIAALKNEEAGPQVPFNLGKMLRPWFQEHADGLSDESSRKWL